MLKGLLPSIRKWFDIMERKMEEEERESIYPDDVADELGLDLKVAMQAVEELIEEGKLEECYNCLSTDSCWGAF